MQLTESSIYINLKKLRSEIYDAQFLMDKSVRIVYGQQILRGIGEALANFIIAFKVENERYEHLKRCIGEFAVVRTDIEFVTDKNLIHYAKCREQNAKGEWVKPADPRDAISSKQIQMLTLVAEIDRDMCKWLASIANGQVRA